MNWLFEPLEDDFSSHDQRIEAAAFVLGFPLLMKIRNAGGFIIGQRQGQDNNKLLACSVLYPRWSNGKPKKSLLSSFSSFLSSALAYYHMSRDGIQMPTFFHNGPKRRKFLRLVQHMDQESERWHDLYCPRDPCSTTDPKTSTTTTKTTYRPQHLFLFQMAAIEPDSNDNDHHPTQTAVSIKTEMLQQMVRAADQCRWPMYMMCSDDPTRALLCQPDMGFVLTATERMVDPDDASRGFDVFILTRQPNFTPTIRP